MDYQIKRLKNFEELMAVMPLILEGFEQMNKRYKAFSVDAEQYTRELIRIVSCQPENGIVVVWAEGKPVGYGVARDNTEWYSNHRVLLLYALYVQPKFSKIYTKPLFQYAESLAIEQGYDELIAYNGRFSGACYRLFERVFGMRRQMVRFSKKLNK